MPAALPSHQRPASTCMSPSTPRTNTTACRKGACGVGVADVESLLRAGVKVCLGTDGFCSTMWAEWKTAYLLQKVWNRDPRRMPADLVAQIAVHNNASLAGIFFPEAPLGVLVPGAFADLIFVD